MRCAIRDSVDAFRNCFFIKRSVKFLRYNKLNYNVYFDKILTSYKNIEFYYNSFTHIYNLQLHNVFITKVFINVSIYFVLKIHYIIRSYNKT